VGAFEFALFGKNYIEFGKYMIKDLYLFIHAVVQEKGADYNKYNKPSDSASPKELELKIQKIEVFSDVKDKLVNTLTLTIPLQHLTDDFAVEFTEAVMTNKGNTNLYIHVVDELSPNKVVLFARQHRIQVNTKFYHLLRNAKKENIIDFQVN